MKRSEGPRRRALRAARVVTLGLVLAAPGCYLAHDVAPQPAPEVAVDAGSDAGEAVADAGRTCEVGGDGWVECCEAIGWDWDRGCAAWGPFVPPGEVA